MNNRRGSVLVATLGFILVFVMLGFGSIYMGTLQNEAAEKQIASTKAFWLAEAGLQKAQWEINHHNCQDLVQEANQQMHCVSCENCGNGSKVLAETIAGYGDYDVVVNSVNTVATSVGSFPSRTPGHPLFIQRKVQVSAFVFNFALFAQNNIDVKNNVEIDGYDSSTGSYDHNNPHYTGDIGSNGAGTSGDSIIKINRSVDILGDVSTGGNGTGYVEYGDSYSNSVFITAGSNPHISCKGSPSPCENIDTHYNNIPLPPVAVPSSLKNLTNSGIITSSATLSTGNYKYTSVQMTNNKVLKIDGQVNLYLTSTGTAFDNGNNFNLILTPGSKLVIYTDGRFVLSNNTEVNNDQKDSDHNGVPDGTGRPSDVQIFSTYTNNDPANPGIMMQDNGAFYGAVYAPQTNVWIENNGGLFGAAVGEEIMVQNNGHIHYDESLGGDLKSSAQWDEI